MRPDVNEQKLTTEVRSAGTPWFLDSVPMQLAVLNTQSMSVDEHTQQSEAGPLKYVV